MKRIFILTTLCLATVVAFAQNPLKKGEKQLNAGIGLASYGTPIYVGLEFGVHEDISVAGEVSYQAKNYTFFKSTGIGVTARGSYHFNRILKIEPQWDLYAGAGLSYYNWSLKDDNGDTYDGAFDYSSGIGLIGHVGGRYFFSDNFGVNLEFGGGTLSGGKLGITYKF